MQPIDSIKTIVIDDEAEACDVLSGLLKSHPEILLAGMADSVDKGLELILHEKPDLVFLDIQMPQKNGFELVSGLRSLNLHPVIVFVTAYDEYAIRAFKVSAFDYLLKPVDPEILAATIRRYHADKTSHDFNSRVDHLLQHLHHDDHIRINTRTGFLMLDPADILYAMADGNYTRIYNAVSQMELASMNLGIFHERMPAGRFVRLSRSVIVNRSHIYRVDRKKRTCELRRDGITVTLEISKGFLKELEGG
jgi:two-component system LytT family response regulator